MVTKYEEVVRNACAMLKGEYAKAVVQGKQRWSGADLKGKAKSYGYTYYAQRQKAKRALFEAGGCIIAVEHGLLVTAVKVADGVYETARGLCYGSEA